MVEAAFDARLSLSFRMRFTTDVLHWHLGNFPYMQCGVRNTTS